MFQQIYCNRFAKVMKNTIIISTFNGVSSNIANTKIQHQQTTTNITKKLWKFKPMIEIATVTNNTFFYFITFNNTNSFPLMNLS